MPETGAAASASMFVPGVRGRLVLLAGATSAAGLAATRTLASAGARVVAVGRDDARLGAVRAAGADGLVCDLTDERAVAELAERLHDVHGRIDGILHLVGGWRGGGGLAGQSDEDYRVLERSLTALRHVTRAFDDDVRESDAGRLAIVSSTAVARPLAGGANYAAVKAASEAWTRAVDQGFGKAARDAGHPRRASATIFRVSSLEGREPQLADAFAALWDGDAADESDRIVELGSS